MILEWFKKGYGCVLAVLGLIFGIVVAYLLISFGIGFRST